MLPLSDIVRNIGRFANDNSPTILTALGAAGTVTTALLTARASFEAAKLLQYEVDDKGYFEEVGFELTKRKARIVWTLFVPPVITGCISVAAIISANTISTKRSAALATAFSLTETAFNEYREKVIEQIGINKEEKVRVAVAEEQMRRNTPPSSEVLIIDNGKVLCYDSMTGRYFQSSVQEIRRAMNEINHEINNQGSASLNDFHRLLGLPETAMGDEVGWNTDKLLEVVFTTILAENDQAAISVGYVYTPIRNFWKSH